MSTVLDLIDPAIASYAYNLDFAQSLKLPKRRSVVITLGSPGRHLVTVLAAENNAIIASGGSECTKSEVYHPRWWETGCRDKLWLGQDFLVWVCPGPGSTSSGGPCQFQTHFYRPPLRGSSGVPSAPPAHERRPICAKLV